MGNTHSRRARARGARRLIESRGIRCRASKGRCLCLGHRFCHAVHNSKLALEELVGWIFAATTATAAAVTATAAAAAAVVGVCAGRGLRVRCSRGCQVATGHTAQRDGVFDRDRVRCLDRRSPWHRQDQGFPADSGTRPDTLVGSQATGVLGEWMLQNSRRTAELANCMPTRHLHAKKRWKHRQVLNDDSLGVWRND